MKCGATVLALASDLARVWCCNSIIDRGQCSNYSEHTPFTYCGCEIENIHFAFIDVIDIFFVDMEF